MASAIAVTLGLSAPASAQENLILCASPGIIDGDTFRCDGNLKIRLWGIDAPERNASGGLQATKALANITAGQTLVCKRRGKSYDRIVAQCWIGRRDVADQLVHQGHAVDLPKFSRGYYSRGTR